MTLFITTIQYGETLAEAITRAGVTAANQGYSGYEIVCDKCGHRIDEHETVQDCQIWQTIKRLKLTL